MYIRGATAILLVLIAIADVGYAAGPGNDCGTGRDAADQFGHLDSLVLVPPVTCAGTVTQNVDLVDGYRVRPTAHSAVTVTLTNPSWIPLTLTSWELDGETRTTIGSDTVTTRRIWMSSGSAHDVAVSQFEPNDRTGSYTLSLSTSAVWIRSFSCQPRSVVGEELSCTAVGAGTTPLEFVIAWGDGSTSASSITPGAGGAAFAASHAYATPGVKTITLSVSNGAGASSSAARSAEVFAHRDVLTGSVRLASSLASNGGRGGVAWIAGGGCHVPDAINVFGVTPLRLVPCVERPSSPGAEAASGTDGVWFAVPGTSLIEIQANTASVCVTRCLVPFSPVQVNVGGPAGSNTWTFAGTGGSPTGQCESSPCRTAESTTRAFTSFRTNHLPGGLGVDVTYTIVIWA